VRWLFARKRAARSWDLSHPLLQWSKHDAWTIGNAAEGCLIFGATGSGKSSGSGRAIALAMLKAGFGGLVLTAKNDERAQWEAYCREAKRLDDLIIFSPSQQHRFNFLDAELSRSGAGAGLTENIVNLFSTVLEIAERNAAGGSGRDEESYWRRATRQLVRNAVDLLALATGRVSVPELYRIIVSAPTSFDQLKSEKWKAESFCFKCLASADKSAKTSIQSSDFELVADYFLLEFPGLSEKTRSVIVSTFTSMIDVINRGVLRELFCGKTNLTPSAVESGKIILVDLPVKEFADVGVIAQVLWKYCFQRAIERRNVATSPRPVFYYADEAQHFVTSYDQQFQTTCRSARVATVLLTQNVSNFEAALGGSHKGKAETASLFANLNTKIIHANGDPETNQWAATLIGRTLQTFVNSSSTHGPDDWLPAAFGMGHAGQTSAGCSEAYEFELQPSVFSSLRTGGPANRGVIDAVVFQSGRRFRAAGKTWLPVTFQQR
jgi:type IV secretory pathway TraG/TraD family ATPase VirD4